VLLLLGQMLLLLG
jgi:hypothetical protein